jgi:8-oxo-dGTP pyrophosphatase MutT (NUDIX family)
VAASGLADLVDALRRHEPADAAEARDRERFLEFVARHRDPFDRRIAEGHLTGSALVTSADGQHVLLVRHRKLQRWLQPGGHAEPGERSGEEVALREAREETGLVGLELHPMAPRPLDLDIHRFPARGTEPEHDHLDLRYLVVAAATQIVRHEGETDDVRWFGWDEVGGLDLDAGLHRALAKARRHETFTSRSLASE